MIGNSIPMIRTFLTLLVFAAVPLLIARWRWFGVAISTFVGWGLVCLVIIALPDAGWDEDAEDWPHVGWLIMLLWSLLCFGAVSLGSWLRRRRRARNVRMTPSGESIPAVRRWRFSFIVTLSATPRRAVADRQEDQGADTLRIYSPLVGFGVAGDAPIPM